MTDRETMIAESGGEAHDRAAAPGSGTDLTFAVGGSASTFDVSDLFGTDGIVMISPGQQMDGVEFLQSTLDGVSNYLGVAIPGRGGPNTITLWGLNPTPNPTPLYLTIQFLLIVGGNPISIVSKTVTVLPATGINSATGLKLRPWKQE